MSWAKRAILSLLIPMIATAAVGQEQTNAVEWEMIEQGDYQAALNALEGSKSASAHLIRAAAYNHLESFDLATSEAFQAVENTSFDRTLLPEAYNQLGLARLLPVLQEILYTSDIDGALSALIEAEDSFRAALEETRGADIADGVYLNLACTLVAQRMIDPDWNNSKELKKVLKTVSRLLPEQQPWVEAVFAEEPTLPEKLSHFTHTAKEKRTYSKPLTPCRQKTAYSVGINPAGDPANNVTKPNRIRGGPPPQYTEAGREARIQGVVIVQAIIDERGIPTCMDVIKSLDPELDERAMDSIGSWRFEPARLNDEPVAVYYNLTVNFRLQ